MSRTIDDIRQTIRNRFMNNELNKQAYDLDPELSFEEQFSPVSTESLIIDEFATAFWVEEQKQILHEQEVDEMLRQRLTPNKNWYKNLLLNFHYGFQRNYETGEWETDGFTEQQIEQAKVIQYAAVDKSIDNLGRVLLILKGATEVNGELQPLSDEVVTAVRDDLEDSEAAGDRINFISYLPDLLQMTIRIVRNPTVLTNNGVDVVSGSVPVENAIKDYLKQLDFNGKLSLQKLEEQILAVDGVEDMNIDLAQTAWIDATTDSYGAYQVIDISKVAVSGYFKVDFDEQSDNQTDITYVE